MQGGALLYVPSITSSKYIYKTNILDRYETKVDQKNRHLVK